MPGTPECPDWLDPDAQCEWDRITEALADLDILRATDTAVLASYCANFSRWKQAEADITKQGTVLKVTGSNGQIKFMKNPALQVSAEAQKAMLRAGSLLGFNPVDRLKIPAKAKPTGNPFAALLNDDPVPPEIE